MDHLSAHHLIMKCARTQMVHTFVNVNKDITMSVAVVKVNVNKGITMSVACVKVQNNSVNCVQYKHACYVFTDVDECENNLNNCSYMCINLNGSYYCVCDFGFSLQDDGETCRSKCHKSL